MVGTSLSEGIKPFPLALFMATQFIMSHTSFPGSFGRLLSPIPGEGVLPKKMGRGVQLASKNPYPVYE